MTEAEWKGLSALGQIAITVDDVAEAVRFYRDVLGVPMLFEAAPGMAFFDCGGVRLMMAPPEQAGGQRHSPALYFSVEDIEGAAASLEDRGIEFEASPHLVAKMPYHDLWMAFFRDPFGNLLALMSEVPKA